MLVSVALAFFAAAVEPSAAASAQLPAPVAKPKRICHVEEATIGSLTPKRTCVTVPATAPAPKPAENTAGSQPQPAPASGN
jgi:hypothetical protein